MEAIRKSSTCSTTSPWSEVISSFPRDTVRFVILKLFARSPIAREMMSDCQIIIRWIRYKLSPNYKMYIRWIVIFVYLVVEALSRSVPQLFEKWFRPSYEISFSIGESWCMECPSIIIHVNSCCSCFSSLEFPSLLSRQFNSDSLKAVRLQFFILRTINCADLER